jgi:hypothetical protein
VHSRAPAVAMTEAQLLETIREAAVLGGWLLYHTRDSRGSAAGFPDLVLVRGNRVIFAECKTEYGRPTHEQLHWLITLRAAGQEAKIWRPSDLDAVLRILLQHSMEIAGDD